VFPQFPKFGMRTDCLLYRFNEPDMPDQDSFGEPVGTYSKAVAMWHEKLEPHAGKVRLGAPAVSNSQVPGQGIDYLRGFLKSCTGCTVLLPYRSTGLVVKSNF
jgi:hypothetical protein